MNQKNKINLMPGATYKFISSKDGFGQGINLTTGEIFLVLKQNNTPFKYYLIYFKNRVIPVRFDEYLDKIELITE